MAVHNELLKAIQRDYDSFRRALDALLNYLDAHPNEEALRIQTLHAIQRYKQRLGSEAVAIAQRVLERLSPHASRRVLLTMLHTGISPHDEDGLGKMFSELAVGYMRDHAGESDWGKLVKDYLFGIHRNPRYTNMETLYPWKAPAVHAIIEGLRQDPQAFESAQSVMRLYDNLALRDIYRTRSVDDATALHDAATLAREYDPTIVFDFAYGIHQAFCDASNTAELLPFAETLWGSVESLARHLVDYFLNYHPIGYDGLMNAALQKYGHDAPFASRFAETILDSIERTFERSDADDAGLRWVLLGWLRQAFLSPHAPIREHIARQLTRILSEHPGMGHSVRDMMWQTVYAAENTPYALIGIGHTLYHSGLDELGVVSEPVMEAAFFRVLPRLSQAYRQSGFNQSWQRLYERLHAAGLPPGVFDEATIREAVERASEDPQWLHEFLRLARAESLKVFPMMGLGSVTAEFVHNHRPEWHESIVAHFLEALNPSALEHTNPLVVDDALRLWALFASYIKGSRLMSDTPSPAVLGRTVPFVLALARALQTPQHQERLDSFYETIGDVFGKVVSARNTAEAVDRLFVLTAPHEVLTKTLRVPVANRDELHEWLCRELGAGS